MTSPRSISPASPSSSAPFGATRILPWKGGARGAILLQFDDSAPSHLDYAIPALLHRGFPASFFVNPGTGPYKSRRQDWRKAASLPGIELANHNHRHVGADDAESFERELALANLEIDPLYPHRPADLLRVWARPTGPGVEWKIGEAAIAGILARHRMIERTCVEYPPAVVPAGAEMREWIDGAIDSGVLRQIVFHGIGADWISTPIGRFIALLDHLETRAAELWITGSSAAYRYALQRDAARVVARETGSGLLRLSLEGSAAPGSPAEPLTLATLLHDRADSATIHQDGRRLAHRVRDDEVVYDALPGAGDILIRC